MYMVSGTALRSRPARAAPSPTRARLTAMCSGVAQLSSTPSATSPASLSICGPSAARYTGAGGRSLAPSDPSMGQPGADLGDVRAHHGDRPVRQADRGPEPGPVAARAHAEDKPAAGELRQGS